MLTHTTEITVRFNEADPLGIVWHGHYIRYFEDGREDFGKKHGLSYLDFYRNGLVVPIVSVNCQFKAPLKYGNVVAVETTYIPTLAAKLKFSYKIFQPETGKLVATGDSEQVFVERDSFTLLLSNPPFFEKWKQAQNFREMK